MIDIDELDLTKTEIIMLIMAFTAATGIMLIEPNESNNLEIEAAVGLTMLFYFMIILSYIAGFLIVKQTYYRIIKKL